MKFRKAFAITLIAILCGCDSQRQASPEAKPPAMASAVAAQKALKKQQAEEQILREKHKGIPKAVASQLLLDASENNKYSIAKVMLEYGADVNIKDGRGYAPLSKAANGGHLQIVSLLIANGANT
jgi:ankyrin repeat protein